MRPRPIAQSRYVAKDIAYYKDDSMFAATPPPLRHRGSFCQTWQPGGGAVLTASDAGPGKLS
eukprot:8266446-Alexandrium_andersonii.AAC.1